MHTQPYKSNVSANADVNVNVNLNTYVTEIGMFWPLAAASWWFGFFTPCCAKQLRKAPSSQKVKGIAARAP